MRSRPWTDRLTALRRVPAAAALSALAVAASGCGGGSGSPVDSGARPAGGHHREAQARADSHATRVIRAWADTLRRGDVAGASRLFALPTVVENGTPALRLSTRAAVRSFNTALPCGARFLRSVRRGRFTVATFELTQRPQGACGSGVGAKASVAFVVRRGKIAVWLRVAGDQPLPARPPTPGAPAPDSVPPAQGPQV